MSMTNLRSQLNQIADRFVSALLNATTAASLAELVDHTGGPWRRRSRGAASALRNAKAAGAVRRRRSSPEEVQRQKEVALTAAKSLKPGFSKGDVMKKSGGAVDLGRALALLVADGKLSKKGDRRSTRYWVK
jgi:hypothetical protein